MKTNAQWMETFDPGWLDGSTVELTPERIDRIQADALLQGKRDGLLMAKRVLREKVARFQGFPGEQVWRSALSCIESTAEKLK